MFEKVAPVISKINSSSSFPKSFFFVFFFIQYIFLSLKHTYKLYVKISCNLCEMHTMYQRKKHEPFILKNLLIHLAIKPKIYDSMSTCIQIEKSRFISDFMRSSMTSLLEHSIVNTTEYRFLLKI